MVDPIKCSNASLNGLVQHLSRQNRHDGRNVEVCLRITTTTKYSAIESTHAEANCNCRLGKVVHKKASLCAVQKQLWLTAAGNDESRQILQMVPRQRTDARKYQCRPMHLNNCYKKLLWNTQQRPVKIAKLTCCCTGPMLGSGKGHLENCHVTVQADGRVTQRDCRGFWLNGLVSGKLSVCFVCVRCLQGYISAGLSCGQARALNESVIANQFQIVTKDVLPDVQLTMSK